MNAGDQRTTEIGNLPKTDLRPLGTVLLGTSLLYVFFMLTNVAIYLPRAMGPSEDKVFATQMLLYVAIIIAYNIFLMIGACAILFRRAYVIAFLSCCFALVPVLGPCWIAGIPIGIWGIVTLLRKDVCNSFR